MFSILQCGKYSGNTGEINFGLYTSRETFLLSYDEKRFNQTSSSRLKYMFPSTLKNVKQKIQNCTKTIQK